MGRTSPSPSRDASASVAVGGRDSNLEAEKLLEDLDRKIRSDLDHGKAAVARDEKGDLGSIAAARGGTGKEKSTQNDLEENRALANPKQPAEAVATVSSAAQADSLVMPLPSPSIPPEALVSQPGAYAERRERAVPSQIGGPPRDDAAEPQDSATSSVGDQATMEEGLVRAIPVQTPVMALEQAEPVDEQDLANSRSRPGQKTRQPSEWCRLGCILGVIVAALLLFGLFASLANRSSSVETATGGTNNTVETNISGEDDVDPVVTLPNGLHLNLPMDLENSTLRILESDMYGTTPQFKAYKWVQDDPWLANYSKARLSQRFSLAALYYATNGNTSWKNVGGGTVAVLYRNSSMAKKLEDEQNPTPSGPPLGAPVGGGGGSGGPSGTSGSSGGPQQGAGNGGPPPGGSNASSGGSNGGGGQGGGPSSPIRMVNVTSQEWLSYESDECEWFSSAFRVTGTTICDADGTMQVLSHKSNGLSGRIPEEIGMLTNLQSIHLWRNPLEGTLVSQFGSMSSLVELNLGSNLFTGTIPRELGKLSNSLRYISANSNLLTGELPQEIWQLSKMEILHLDRNEIGGSFPSDLGRHMPNLKILTSRQTQLTGTLFTSMPPGLLSLQVQENNLRGPLPSELGLLDSSLVKVRVDSNQLTGSLPSELGLLTRLYLLSVAGNEQITGPLPSELGLLNGTLLTFDLSGTSISGTIPSELCGISSLTFDCSESLCGCSCPCIL